MRLTYKTWKGRGRHEQAGLEIGFHDQDREWGDIGKLGDRQVEEKHFHLVAYTQFRQVQARLG
eukprot:1158557-Pelagomonas_calceolata.AAC.3